MKLSFSHRIFGGMFLVILFTAIFIFILFSYYFKNQSEHYHEKRLKRIEDRVVSTVEYEMDEYPETVSVENLPEVLGNRIYGIANVNNQKINVFSLDGDLILSTETIANQGNHQITDKIKQQLVSSVDGIHIVKEENSDGVRIEGYRYLHNIKREAIAIVHLPYFSNNEQFEKEQNTLIWRLVGVLLIINIIGAIFAWIMSTQITKRLKSIALKLKNTEMVNDNKPIEYKGNDEVKVLVDSYNEMLYKLKGQTALLAVKEREAAWRDMAKQVAHEVKNPLTPMRLMIQNFRQRFDPESERNVEKVNDLSDTLLHQIDTISSIAEAFSSFAKMPERNDETINLVEETKICLNVFKSKSIQFESSDEQIFYEIDKSYLTRIINNLVKNAFQSVPNDTEPEIKVSILKESNHISIAVEDNGTGIPEDLKDKIFVPKFTTKSSGMGLGLPMVKQIIDDYNGTISFKSSATNHGTVFTVDFPINK